MYTVLLRVTLTLTLILTNTSFSLAISWNSVRALVHRRGSVVRASVSDWRTFPDMRLIYGRRVTTSWVRRPLWLNQPGQLSLLPSVGRGMSSIIG